MDLAAPPNEVSEARRGGARMLEQEYRSGGCGEAASWQGDVKDSSVTEPADPTQGTTREHADVVGRRSRLSGRDGVLPPGWPYRSWVVTAGDGGPVGLQCGET